MLPVLALYLGDLGASGGDTGLVLGLGTIVGALAILPAGQLADRIGRRPVLVVCAASGTLGAAALLPLTDWRGAFVGSTLYWASIAGLPLMAAHLAATVEPRRLGAAMGLMYGAYFFGSIGAAPLAGPLAAALGLRAPILAGAILFAAALLCMSRIRAGRPTVTERGRLPATLRPLLAAAPLAGVLAYLPLPLFAVYVRDVARVPLELVGVAVGAVSLGSAIAVALGGRAADRFGAVPTLVIAAAAATAGGAMIAFGSASTLTLVAGALLIGANQAPTPVVGAAVSRLLPPSRMAFGYATLQLAFTIGAGAGGIAAGLLHDMDPLLPYLATAALALPVTGVVIVVVRGALGRTERIDSPA